jgi:hypothetical protein
MSDKEVIIIAVVTFLSIAFGPVALSKRARPPSNRESRAVRRWRAQRDNDGDR